MIKTEIMAQRHVAKVSQLEKLCFSDPWSENSVASELENPLSLWIVAMDGDVLAGYVGSQSVMGEADMMNLAVAPEYRRQGIACELVQVLVRTLKQNKVSSITLEVRVSNDQAISLYEKLGFVRTGLRKNYYRNPREDGLILRKEWEI